MQADEQHPQIMPSQEQADGSDSVTEYSRVSIKQRWSRGMSGVLAPLRIRDYLLLFSGQLISYIGDAFYVVALPWFMLSSGGGAQALGIVLSAYGVPRAGAILLGGSLSDRLRPRRLMLLTDMVRAVLVGVLAALIVEGHPSLWLLCVFSALLGAFAGLFTPAAMSITPDVLPDDRLQAGNALRTSSQQIAGMVGSSLAGFVVSRFQPGIAILIDALSFMVSAVTLALMSHGGRKQAHTQVEATTSDDEHVETSMTFWQLLHTSRYLQILLVMTIFMNLGGGAAFGVALPAFVHDDIKAGANGYGFILAAFSVGAVMGALGAGAAGKIPHRKMVGLVFFIVQSIAIGSIPFLHSVLATCGVMVLAGTMNGLGNVISITVIQQVLPRHLLGRVMSALAFANFGFYPLSVALGGSIVAHFGVVLIFLAYTVLIAIPCVFGLLQREFQEEVSIAN
jgi:MFS family permease